MKVIGFCGLPGSGKSTAIEAIRDLGIVITMGDVIRNEAKRRDIKPTSENLGKIAKELRAQGGPGIIAKKCVEMIKQKTIENIFIDGVRSLFEVDEFRKSWKFPLIATKIDENTRFKRLSERGRSDDPRTIEDLKSRDERETEFGTLYVIEMADQVIENESNIERFKQIVREIVLSVLKDYQI